MAMTAASRYAVLEPKRLDYLERARKCSELTIPHLFPPDGATSSTTFKTPYQSLGARGVNNLSSKLLLSLLPPNSPFFKMALSDNELEQLKAIAQDQPDLKTFIETGLSKIEKRVQTWLEAVAVRPSADEMLKQLIVGGNVCLQVDAKVGMRVQRLDRYVVRRDHSGLVIEAYIKEPVDEDVLPEEVKKLLKVEGPQSSEDAPRKKEKFLYTSIRLQGGKYEVHQEIDEKRIPNSEGSYNIGECPFLFLRFTKVACEDYGRSYVEQYFGDLKSLEGLTKSVVLSAQVTGKAVVMVRPGGVTNAKTLSKAETGDVVTGDMNDVAMLQFDKWADLRIAFEAIKSIEQRLAFAFLLNTAIQRPGERVTAEEIRYMARELDDALGGTYATFSQDFQLPFLKAVLRELETGASKEHKLPKLPKEINPVLVTGLEALGRGHDLQKLDAFLGPLMQDPDVRASINMDVYLSRRALALGVDTDGLIKTAEEKQAEQEQAMMMQMAQKLGPPAINQMGGMAKAGMENGQAPEAPTQG